MNDNTNPEGPRHAQALRLINELQVLLAMAGRMSKNQHYSAVCEGFDFEFWAGECRKAAGGKGGLVEELLAAYDPLC